MLVVRIVDTGDGGSAAYCAYPRDVPLDHAELRDADTTRFEYAAYLPSVSDEEPDLVTGFVRFPRERCHLARPRPPSSKLTGPASHPIGRALDSIASGVHE